MNEQKIAIYVVCDQSDVGKTTNAMILGQTLRKSAKVDIYVCDENYQSLYTAMGEKDSKGSLIPLRKQDPSKGST